MWGGPPWTAADARVGLRFECVGRAGPRGSGADVGVRTTVIYPSDFCLVTLAGFWRLRIQCSTHKNDPLSAHRGPASFSTTQCAQYCYRCCNQNY